MNFSRNLTRPFDVRKEDKIEILKVVQQKNHKEIIEFQSQIGRLKGQNTTSAKDNITFLIVT